MPQGAARCPFCPCPDDPLLVLPMVVGGSTQDDAAVAFQGEWRKREEERREEERKLLEEKERTNVKAAKHEDEMRALSDRVAANEPLTASEHAALRRWAGLPPLSSSSGKRGGEQEHAQQLHVRTSILEVSFQAAGYTELVFLAFDFMHYFRIQGCLVLSVSFFLCQFLRAPRIQQSLSGVLGARGARLHGLGGGFTERFPYPARCLVRRIRARAVRPGHYSTSPWYPAVTFGVYALEVYRTIGFFRDDVREYLAITCSASVLPDEHKIIGSSGRRHQVDFGSHLIGVCVA